MAVSVATPQDLSSLPPFPTNVPTHPLLVIDYELIKARDEAEIDRLWQAATQLGFWYLKNHGVDEDVNRMFAMGAEMMALPLEEKMKYEQGDDGVSFGYKKAGANAIDATGALDTAEFINISSDDALAFLSSPSSPPELRKSYPPTVVKNMSTAITPFVSKSLSINTTLLAVFNDKLGLPEGALEKRHPKGEWSGSEARVIRNPPPPTNNGDWEEASRRVAIGSHTDFGSLSFLHNRLGGLQVLVPGSETWQYVKPLPNHAICNIGDALALFSGGILRSNMHRVLPPPPPQTPHERWSLVYFTRPGNSVTLRALVEESKIIAEAVNSSPEERRKAFNTGSTALEWFSRRIKNQRIANRKGPETWMASRGTEHAAHRN